MPQIQFGHFPQALSLAPQAIFMEMLFLTPSTLRGTTVAKSLAM